MPHHGNFVGVSVEAPSPFFFEGLVTSPSSDRNHQLGFPIYLITILIAVMLSSCLFTDGLQLSLLSTFQGIPVSVASR